MPGRLVRLRAEVATETRAVTGTLAGEPLHFERDAAGRFSAIAAIPLDARDSVRVPLVVDRGGGRADSVSRWLSLPRSPLPDESAAAPRAPSRLRVDARFGREPDSAVAARTADEAARARAVAIAAHDTPRLWRGSWLAPRGGRVTSGFASGREFNGTVRSVHMGTDFAGRVGDPVRAPARGVVRLTGAFFLGGNVVYVDHGAGLVSAYLHLSRTRVAVGDTVERGQRIGDVGQTGRVTGPHLHWIIRYGSITVDPLSIFPVAGGQLPVATKKQKRRATRHKARGTRHEALGLVS